MRQLISRQVQEIGSRLTRRSTTTHVTPTTLLQTSEHSFSALVSSEIAQLLISKNATTGFLRRPSASEKAIMSDQHREPQATREKRNIIAHLSCLLIRQQATPRLVHFQPHLPPPLRKYSWARTACTVCNPGEGHLVRYSRVLVAGLRTIRCLSRY